MRLFHWRKGQCPRQESNLRTRFLGNRCFTAPLARLFGGTAKRPYDVCYHQSCDAVANINMRVLSAAAVVALRLAG
jgi:hypothetical protein